MIYAINKLTKEHLAHSAPCLDDVARCPGWNYVQADADGWIPWHGGKCPLPDGAGYEAKLANGDIRDIAAWWDRRGHTDMHVVAYRPILDADSEPAPEWDGGLPPVGTACEMESPILGMWHKEWLPVQVVAIKGDIAIGWCADKNIALWACAGRIRTAAQRAEDAITETIYRCAAADNISARAAACAIVSAMQDGKIPGVTLEEK